MKLLSSILWNLIKTVAVLFVIAVLIFIEWEPQPVSKRPTLDSVQKVLDDTTTLNHSELPDSVHIIHIPAPNPYQIDSVEVNGVNVPVIYTENKCQKILTVKRKVLFLFKVYQNERIFRGSEANRHG